MNKRTEQLATRTAIWTPTTSELPRALAVPPVDYLFAPIAAIVMRAPDSGETVMVAHARKEGDLRDLFAGLSALESRVLQRRLERGAADDRIAELFQRLAPDRRRRLLAFLADARRRDSTRGARGLRR